MNRQHRLAPASQRSARPANPAAGQFLLITMVVFCALAWSLMQWGSSQSRTPSSTNSQNQTAPQPTNAQGTLHEIEQVSVDVAPAPTYNPDPWGTLMVVLEQQGEGLLLVGGSVFGGMVLLLVAARYVSRIPKDPLATGLGQTLTLLENNHRAGNLTPMRALEVARQAVGEREQEHESTIVARTRAYDDAVAQLTKSHAEAISAIRTEATQAVKQAQTEASQAAAREAAALQRVANTEAQVSQLSRDLATTHTQLTEASTTARMQAEEIVALTAAVEEATETLLRWQTAHRDLSVQHQELQTAHSDLKNKLADAETIASDATTRAETAEAEAQTLRTEREHLQGQEQSLKAELVVANTELSRLRGVSLRELPMKITDREGDLAPHMATIVEIIRGIRVDTGTSGGERTNKPILESWRDIRRLLQVWKGVGIRFAVAAHHAPKWVERAEETTRSATTAGEKTQNAGDENISTVPALTDLLVSAHNGISTDSIASQAGASTLQNI